MEPLQEPSDMSPFAICPSASSEINEVKKHNVVYWVDH